MKKLLMLLVAAIAGSALSAELPDDYKALSYVRSTGSAFIDTGYALGSNSRVEMDFEIDTVRFSGMAIPFGWAGSAEPHAFIYFDGSKWWAVVGAQWKNWAAGSPALAGRKTLVFNDADGNTMLDGMVVATKNGAAFTCTGSAYIFARHDPGDAVTQPTPMKLYSFKIFENGSLVREYVPALKRDTRTCGLYETQTKDFLTHDDLQMAGLVEIVNEYGVSVPMNGWIEGMVDGGERLFYSQRKWNSADGRESATCTGWRFTRLDGTVEEGQGNVMRLTYDDTRDYGGTLEWIWTRNYIDQLPEGYAVLPKLTSSGTQYIDTEVTLDSTMWVDASISVSSQCVPFGSEGNEGEYWFCFFDPAESRFVPAIGSFDWTKCITVNPVFGRHKIVMNYDRRLIVDGNASAHLSGTCTAPCTAYVFARHDLSSGEKANCAAIDLHSFDIFGANGPIRSYVPAIRVADGERGLYDLVTSTFATNRGTGAFGPASFIRVKDGEGCLSCQAVGTGLLAFAAPRSVDAQGRSRVCTGWRLTRLNGEIVTDVTDEFVFHYDGAIDEGALLEWFYRDADADELPDEYVRLNAIRTDGSGAYIDTEIVPDSTFNLRLQFRNEPSPVGASTIPFGVECAADRYCFLYPNPGESKWNLYWGNQVIKTGANAPPLYGVHDFQISTLDNVNVLDGYGAEYKCTSSYTAADTAYLFARNDSGTAKWFAPMDLYGCTMRTNGVVARAFVPAQRAADFTVGLYDMVEGRFYPNDGTGAFWPQGGIVWVDGALVDGHAVGQRYTYSAPAVTRNASALVHRTCCGWRFTRRDGSVQEGEGGTVTRAFAAADNGGRLEWLWREMGRGQEVRRSRLTFAANAVTGYAALTNFPVLVRLSAARVPGFAYDQCAADGADIRFSASPSGADTLPCEVDTWNPQGESTFWVRVPVVDNGGSFYMFWGDGVAQTRTPTEVWTDYAGVWHFGSCVENAFADSVANGHPLTLKPSENPVTLTTDPVVAQVGSAKAGTGSLFLADYLSIVANARNDGKRTEYTLSGWFHAPSAPAWFYPFSAHSGVGHNGWYIEATALTLMKMQLYRTDGQSAMFTSVPNYRAEWMHLAVVAEEGHAKVAINGVWIPGYVFPSSLLTEEGVPLELPTDHLDEVRLSARAFSGDWMKAESRQVSDPDFLRAEDALLLEKLPMGTVFLVR